MVRIGADDVNNSVWVPSATFVTPGTTSPNVGTAEVDALAQFLTATGWKAIDAVNMRGTSTTQTAVTEFTYVVPKLGASLLAVEIGNELNLYGDLERPRASGTRTRRRFTGISRGHADRRSGRSSRTSTTRPSSSTARAALIDLVTHHYYRGQAGTSTATLANLVNLDPVVTSGSQALARPVKTTRFPAASARAR